MLVFKNLIITDSRMILLGAHLGKSDGDDAVDTIDGIYNETKNAYDMLA